MSDDHRMSPDGEYIQFQMENPGIHDAPAPTGDNYKNGWEAVKKIGDIVSNDAPAPAAWDDNLPEVEIGECPAPAAVSNLNLQVGETLTREKLDSVFRYLSDFVTAARAEDRKAVYSSCLGKAKGYRSQMLVAAENIFGEHCCAESDLYLGGGDLAAKIIVESIEKAARADGVDLTSLAKPE